MERLTRDYIPELTIFMQRVTRPFTLGERSGDPVKGLAGKTSFLVPSRKKNLIGRQQHQIKKVARKSNHDWVYSYTIVDLVQKPVGGVHDDW